MHRLATIHNVTDRQTDRRNTVPVARPLVWSAKNVKIIFVNIFMIIRSIYFKPWLLFLWIHVSNVWLLSGIENSSNSFSFHLRITSIDTLVVSLAFSQMLKNTLNIYFHHSHSVTFICSWSGAYLIKLNTHMMLFHSSSEVRTSFVSRLLP